MDSIFHKFFAGNSSPATLIPISTPESSVSDCESGVTGSSTDTLSSGDSLRRVLFSENLTVEIPETERSYDLIRRRFLARIDNTADVDVVAVHRKKWSENPTSKAKIQAFQIYSNALENKYSGNSNVKFGWYGCDKDRIEKILEYGFSYNDLMINNNNHGAILISTDDSPNQSLDDSGSDKDGLRHMLLCRVLLGQSELVQLGSGQTHPSSNEFDSGLDSYENPKKYIIWSNNMNTHILPEYVVTFRTKSAQLSQKGGVSKMKNGIKMPTSPWISFPALISVLAKFLPFDAIALISKYHKDYKEKKLSRPDLIQKVRQIAGDKLLIAVIKSFKGTKETKMSFGLSHHKNRSNNY